MTATDALGALEIACIARLRESSGWTAAVWGDRCYTDRAPASATRPYAVGFWSGGGDRNAVPAQDAEIVMIWKVVADSKAEAAQGAAQLTERLDNQGTQDRPTTALDGGADWYILTSTAEDAVHLFEPFEDAAPIWHRGAIFRFVMEVK